MPDAIPARTAASLPVCDPDRAERARERIDPDALEAWSGREDFLDAVLAASPYLGRLAARRPRTLARLASDSPEILTDEACAVALEAGGLDDAEAVMAALRRAKADLHLTAALADLSGAWTLRDMTAAISRFADAAVQGALAAAARMSGFAVADPGNPVPGYFALALGKLGAGTLNYSSDIDLVVMFEPDTAQPPDGKEPRKAFARLAQKLAHLLQEATADGYVFRVDLRLRPDPSSTPPAVSASMARGYFEAVGQNWERAAYAKARWCAGDRAAAEGFLADLEPFIWRRSLDYAAVEDIRALARQIQTVGDRAQISSAGHDLKLGRGGIREIEFYAQVLQLVFGGRKREVRVARTVDALKVLGEEGLAPPEETAALTEAYRFLRRAEHRVQMLDDEQTQSLPKNDARRAAVAAMMGQADLAAFDAEVVAVLKSVHAAFSAQFSDGDSLATGLGSLVLTGVEPTPDTLQTLASLGFSDPARVWETLSGWAAGRARAARTERARRLFSQLAPRLVEAISATGDPDAAFTRFATFFEGLPSGVQPLSLLINHPELADELIRILGLAPRLADILAKRPALMDVMLDPGFVRPLREEDPEETAADLAARMRPPAGRDGFEAALNAARRVAREERLRIGAQMLLGRATAGEAGRAYSALADVAVRAMAEAACAEVSRRHGPPPGRWAVLGLGKMGGRELSADSDLDMMVVYDPEAEQSDGDKPLGGETWFGRFTQRLVSALSAPTEEGELYPVDMALRPSGSAGPIAVRLSRFSAYYASEAWTWERMALTRARVVADDRMADDMERALDSAVGLDLPDDAIKRDVAAMRARLQRDKPSRGKWDLKQRPGGQIDIEFIAQTGQLCVKRRLSPSTVQALEALADTRFLPARAAARLAEAARDYAAITQLVRLAHGSGFDPDHASQPFAARLCTALDVPDMPALTAKLDAHAKAVRAHFLRHVGKPRMPRDG